MFRLGELIRWVTSNKTSAFGGVLTGSGIIEGSPRFLLDLDVVFLMMDV
jgi:hypothetical protein